MSPHNDNSSDRVCVDESGRVCVDEGSRVARAKASCTRIGARLTALLHTRPYLHWVFVYVVTLVYFLCYRLSALTAYVLMFGSKRDNTFGVKFSGVVFGFVEDVACVNYLALVLWCFDATMRHAAGIYRFAKRSSDDSAMRPGVRRTLSIAKHALRFIVYLVGFVIVAAPVVANNLMIRLRQMRFTLEYITMYMNEKDAASGFVVPDYEIRAATRTIVITAVVALFFSIVGAVWIDLSLWTPLELAFSCCRRRCSSDEPEAEDTLTPIERQQLLQGTPVNSLDASADFTDLEQQTEASPHSPQTATKGATSGSNKKMLFETTKAQAIKLQSRLKTQWWRVLLALAIIVFALVVLPYIVLEIAQHSVSAAVAGVALNTSLSEFFRLLFTKECLPGLANGDIDSAAFFIDGTSEEYSLFQDDVLYRRTTGFKGDLAFDLDVDQTNLPNVLVIAVESFRYHDSQYLVGDEHKYLLKEQNITVTPNFDRWAKRGIAFRNFWSSWRTSRSVESILYGQLPYDSVTTSGTTGGSEGVKLSGMPQLFKAKGYESVFTAGCRTDYDGWHDFLLTHGFDKILDMVQFKQIAERELGLNPKDWAQVADGGKGRAMSYWGVHDDVSFDVLGNILVNKTTAQKQRMTKNEAKKPFFINHYTISSHGPFGERPQWYVDYPKPDFSKLVEGEKYPIGVQDYLDMRYFTDLAIGKFLDRMEKEGVLNDTIVFITGDHGQAPEAGFTTPESREVSATRVAATMIAEGRLGKYAGMVFDDAAEQYDLLNTFADIVGLPTGGFEQTGVGRSLKRKIPFGQRIVWSNNPNRKMSVVRGHERLQYDVMSNGVFLHNADADHDMKHDLFDAQTPEQQDIWIALRNAGRKANAYFKKRWHRSCLLKVKC